MIEALGRGIDKMIKLCLSNGLLEPVFDIGFGGLQIEFTAKVDDVEKSTEKTTYRIIKLMQENHDITIEQLSVELKLTPGAINKQIAKLKSNNKIKRIGPKKGGYWRIVD